VGEKNSGAKKRQRSNRGFHHYASPYRWGMLYQSNVSARFHEPAKMVSRPIAEVAAGGI
jgi:hypothetical protein